MVFKNIEFHNVGELIQIEGQAGYRMQRYPEAVRVHLNDNAQGKALNSAGVELRFLSDSDTVKLTLSCPDGFCDVIPFYGEFQYSSSKITVENETKTIELTYPERLKQLEPQCADSQAFSIRTWRVMLTGGPVFFIDCEGENVRPPEASDLPKVRMMAYGTSITQGYQASRVTTSYVTQTARRLGFDVLNMALSGSCHCEPELADYLGSRKDWDMITLELSVNMVGGFSTEEFRSRVKYLMERVAGQNPDKKVFCITILPYYADICSGFQKEKTQSFRQIYRDIVKELNYPNVYLVEGEDLLKNISGLSVDLIHPSDYGMIEVAQNLADFIKGKM